MPGFLRPSRGHSVIRRAAGCLSLTPTARAALRCGDDQSTTRGKHSVAWGGCDGMTCFYCPLMHTAGRAVDAGGCRLHQSGKQEQADYDYCILLVACGTKARSNVRGMAALLLPLGCASGVLGSACALMLLMLLCPYHAGWSCRRL